MTRDEQDPRGAAAAPAGGAPGGGAERQSETLEALREAMSRIESGESGPSSLWDPEPAATDDSAPQTRPAGETGEAGAAAEAASPAEAAASGVSGSSGSSESSSGGGSAYEEARAVVLRKLTGSAKSRHQLAEALRAKDVEESVIGHVLDRMTEVGLIDDAAFARTWVATRHEFKGLGRTALRHELLDRGVSEPDIEQALEQIDPEDEDAAARELVEKKLRGVVVPAGNGPEERREREKHMRRLVAMLGRRGHAPSTAFRTVQDVLEEHTA